MDNSTVAAYIGIKHVEMLKAADDIARNILWVVNNAERLALKKVKSHEDIVAGLTVVFNDIATLVHRKAQVKLRWYSDQICKIMADAIFNLDIEESRTRLARMNILGVSGADILRIIQAQGVSTRIANHMAKSGLTPQRVATDAIMRGEEAIRRSVVSQYFARMREVAYKIGRTSVSQMASNVSRRTYDSLPRSLVGFQIHGILDDRIRPAHRERNGTVYYKTPQYGNEGFGEMPNPPLEADGSVAWNCRCWLSPIVASSPDKFFDFKGRIIPNPRVFNEWFSTSPKSLQVLATGVKRYQEAEKRLKKGEKLAWWHLMDPSSGALLDAAELRLETYQARTARIKKAKNLIFKT